MTRQSEDAAGTAAEERRRAVVVSETLVQRDNELAAARREVAAAAKENQELKRVVNARVGDVRLASQDLAMMTRENQVTRLGNHVHSIKFYIVFTLETSTCSHRLSLLFLPLLTARIDPPT